ncbi:hypothetical protein ACFB49_14110 [Sphingomonas sp. DBB INV C78]|uniref:hypothetical protein n=1 Tax=Sphingomonas sp. DBB INV C78 TaxID=3349434 RepID=UPI0036D3A82D
MAGDSDIRILGLLADELDAARATLERLGMALCSNPAVAAQHMAELQSLDDIGQRQAAIATILRAQDISEAAGKITLESICRRLGTV